MRTRTWVPVALGLLVACGDDADRGPDRMLEPVVVGDPIGDPLFHDEVVLDEEGRAEVLVEVPTDAGAVGVTVVGQPDRDYRLCSWETASDTWIYGGWENNSFVFCDGCKNRVVEQTEVHSVLGPNSSGLAMEAGEHRLVVCGDFEDDPVHVTVVTAPQRDAGEAAVDLALYLTGANGWTAASWPSDAALATLMDEATLILAGAGLEARVVGAFDLPEALTLAFGSGSADAVRGLDAHPAGAIPIILSQRLDAQLPILAISLGLPGPFVTGTAAGAVVVSLEDAAADPRPLSRLLAHEVGHYLGLYHTTEAVFEAHDTLSDTPNDDDSYLMHALPQGDVISDEQGVMVRRNPHVYAP